MAAVRAHTAELGAAAGIDSVTARRRARIAFAAAIGAVLLTLAHPYVKVVFDLPVEAALNRVARHYPWLDYSLRILDRFPAFQGVALTALLCGALVEARRRSEVLQLVVGLFTASFAAVLSRLVQHFLPPNPRPLYDAALPFVPPLGADVGALRDYSSFPSDHAALLWGLACVLSLVRPRLAVFAFAWVAVLGLVRTYGGYHYLSDTLAGWLLGTTVVFAGAALPLQRLEPVLAWAWRYRFLAVALLFFAAIEAADMFNDIRGIGRFIFNIIRGAPGVWV